MKKLWLFLLSIPILTLGACSTGQLTAADNLSQDIATLIVKIDCSNPNLITLLATDVNASKRLKAIAASVTKTSTDLCPLLPLGTPVAVTVAGSS